MRLALMLILLGIAGPALAAANTSTPTAPSGFLIALLVVYATRRRAIGGWLFYFFVQTYFSALLAGVLTAMGASNFEMARWDSAKLYVWYLLSLVPALAAQAWEVIVATQLLRNRTAQNLERMRTATTAVLVTAAVALCIDIAYFDQAVTLMMDILGLFFAIVWFAYFRRSLRVKAVFVDHNWVNPHEEAAKKPLTAVERKYLRKRALVVGLVFYIGTVVLLAQGVDEPPTSALFLSPLPLALLAALCGRYLTLDEKKRASLAAAAARAVTPTV